MWYGGGGSGGRWITDYVSSDPGAGSLLLILLDWKLPLVLSLALFLPRDPVNSFAFGLRTV